MHPDRQVTACVSLFADRQKLGALGQYHLNPNLRFQQHRSFGHYELTLQAEEAWELGLGSRDPSLFATGLEDRPYTPFAKP